MGGQSLQFSTGEFPAKVGRTDSRGSVLIVEDETVMRMALARVLGQLGYDVHTARDGSEAIETLSGDEHFDAALVDICMPGASGMEVLEVAVQQRPTLAVVMMTGRATMDTAVRSLKLGAFDFISKPFDDIFEVCDSRVGRAVEHAQHTHNAALAASRPAVPAVGAEPFEGMVGNSPPMRRLFERITAVAPARASVLVHGETGVGKELVARAIHQRSYRSRRPFVPLNCAAIPADLLESELFGHEKGAFTGADRDRVGLFESADKGTLFLDEIGEMPMALQAKLLRAVESGEFRRVGSTRTQSVDVRIIAATHQHLRQRISAGTFREDLFYRLAVVTIEVPALRSRGDHDLEALCDHFLINAPVPEGTRTPRLTRQAQRCLNQYDWPGNVRELRNIIEGAVIFAVDGVIDVAQLPERVARRPVRTPSKLPNPHPDILGLDFVEAKRQVVQEFESFYLSALMERSDGNISQAARTAGMDRSNFKRLLKRHKSH